ncbi:MAG: class I SAM-dependent methyltransferase [Solirubrobacteraceae bacterium]
MSDAIEAFSRHAPEYDAQRRAIVPCFEEFYGTAAELVSLRGGQVRRVLDLGAGTGLLSEAVLARHPDAELVLLDGSEEMLARAGERLGSSARMVLADLRAELPAGPFDAVVSSLAIHHLEQPDQLALYERIPAVLRPGGVFVNAEHIAAPTSWLERVSRERWREAAMAAGASAEEVAASDERMELNRCATVATQLEWLARSGLQDCDCFFKELHFVVLAGWRAEGQ